MTLLQFDDEYKEAAKEHPYVLTEKWTGYAANAVVGMGVWAVAMREYHLASKIVKPRMVLLNLKQEQLAEAEERLRIARGEQAAADAVKADLKARHEKSQAEKDLLERDAAATKKKMDHATRLINSLKDNKARWVQDAENAQLQKKRLAGDVAKACAFVSYCGPFNAEFRRRLLDERFHADIEAKEIPVSADMEVTSFFVDHEILGQWAMEGLPADDLSVQNGIMVTRSSRYPLMIDPQGQALSWVLRREPDLAEHPACVQTLSNPRLREELKLPLAVGLPVLIQSVENEVDPLLDPILEK
jgi:dynein heavy chain, axonemal